MNEVREHELILDRTVVNMTLLNVELCCEVVIGGAEYGPRWIMYTNGRLVIHAREVQIGMETYREVVTMHVTHKFVMLDQVLLFMGHVSGVEVGHCTFEYTDHDDEILVNLGRCCP